MRLARSQLPCSVVQNPILGWKRALGCRGPWPLLKQCTECKQCRFKLLEEYKTKWFS